jgi:TonB family protein
METVVCLVKPSLREIFFRACIVSVLTATGAVVAFAQDPATPQERCEIDIHLKAIKMVDGKYSEEAIKKSVEGTVVMCVTVNAEGKVADVKQVSGPPELAQSSIDAVKQWQFERPTSGPAMTTVEMNYSLTKACPGGGKGTDSGEVKVNIESRHTLEGEAGEPLRIVCTLSQPLPPYPDKARAERRRGQLYLSISVNGNGEVVDAKIVMALDELLDKPALDAVRRWKFKVAPLGGKTTVFPVTLSFKIPCLDQPESSFP